jgi:hypothetical protein
MAAFPRFSDLCGSCRLIETANSMLTVVLAELLKKRLGVAVVARRKLTRSKVHQAISR